MGTSHAVFDAWACPAQEKTTRAQELERETRGPSGFYAG